MVSFRNVMMVVALLALCAGIASAQAGVYAGCWVTGNTGILRAEGVTEPLPPLTINCNIVGLSAAVNPASNYNITIYGQTGVPFTSQFDAKSTGKDEVQIQGLAGIVAANGATITASSVVPNWGTWEPASGGNPSYQPVSITIVGLRVNASMMTASVGGIPASLQFTLLAQTTSNTEPNLFSGGPVYSIPNVAYAVPSMTFSAAASGVTLNQCPPYNALGSPWLSTSFSVTFKEIGTSAAFLTAHDEGIDDQQVAPAVPANFVTNGTRLIVWFTNIPANVSLTVPNTISAVAGTSVGLGIVSKPNADFSGGTVATAAGTTTVSLSGGAGAVAYEVTAESTSAFENVTIPVTVLYAGSGLPSLTSAASEPSVAGQYGPISGTGLPTAIGAGVVPRFAAITPAPVKDMFDIGTCQTTLLFPFITNAAGWSTSVAVANTGLDPFGTVGQSGNCQFSFYGGPLGGASTLTKVSFGASGFGDTTAIAPGVTSADQVANSGVGATFAFGYAIAQCNFQYAHGYSFVVGANQKGAFSNGYVGLVLASGNKLLRGSSTGQFEDDRQ